MIRRLNRRQKNNSFVGSLTLTLLVIGSFFVASFLPIFSSQTAFAAINQQINYQGKLFDNNNVTVADGSYNMEFKLYTSPTGTSSVVWTETRTSTDKVSVASGLFSVMLGSVTSLSGINFNQTLYLGVNIGGSGGCGGGFSCGDGEMTPRKVLGAVPASFEALNLGGASSTQYLRSDQAGTLFASSTQTALTITQIGSGNIFSAGNNSSTFLSILNNGNVGIGSSTPIATLSVKGTGGTNPFVVASSTGSQLLTLLQNGKFGIGSSTPTELLSVAGNGLFTGLTTVSGAGTSTFSNNLSVGGSLALTASLFDSTGSAGANGKILQTTGSATQWVSTSTLGILATPAGSTGQVQFNNAGALGADSNFFWDNSAKRLGLGTSSPTAALDVWGNLNVATSSTSTLIVKTDTSFVGINTSSPVVSLDTRGRLSVAPSGTTPDTGYTGSLIITKPAASGQYINLIRAATFPWSIGMVYNTNTFGIGQGNGTDSSFTSPIFNIMSTGFVGIGTTTPVSKLAVLSTTEQLRLNYDSADFTKFTVDSGSGLTITPGKDLASAFNFTKSDGSTSVLDIDTSNTRVGIGSSTPIATLSVKGTGGTNPFVIASSTNTQLITLLQNGNFGVGSSSPSRRLSVSGDISVTGAYYDSSASAGTSGKVLSTTGSGTSWTDTIPSLTITNLTSDNITVNTSIGGAGWYSSLNSLNPINVGYGNSSAGGDSASVGYINVSTDGSYAFGGENALSDRNTLAFGKSNEVSKGGSGAFGYNNNISGSNSFAFGGDLTISPDDTVVLGNSANKITLDGSGLDLDAGALMFATDAGAPGAVLKSNGGGLLPAWTDIFTVLGGTPFFQGGNSFGGLGVLGTLDGNALSFKTNSNEVARFDTSGNFGIGTTSPSQKLDVWGNLNVATSSTSIFIANSATRKVGVGSSTPIATLSVKGSGSLNPFVVASSTDTQLLTLLPNGKFGIGSSTPTELLSVAGNGLFTGLLNVSGAGTSTFKNNVAIGGSNVTANNSSLAVGSSADSSSFIQAIGNGSFAFGRASLGDVSGTSVIKASGQGSLALGYIENFDANNFIQATNAGSIALGNASGGFNISSTGFGSFAFGYAVNGSISATGQGSLAFGDNINSTATQAISFGSGFTNNSTAFQVGYSSTPTLTVNATTLGVASTTPFATLSVKGAGTGTGFTFQTTDSSNVPTLTLLDNGKFGIGSSSPIATLAVKGAGGINPFVISSSTNAQLLTLLQNGKFGIGSSTPTELLSVAGNGLFTGLTIVSGAGTSTFSNNLSIGGSLSLTASLFDSAGLAGANGSILKSTGSATQWVATSTLGLQAATTTFAGYRISDSSANLRSALTDSTGTGLTVFGTAPTFTTSIIDPLVIGGTLSNSTLTLKSSNFVGVPAGDAIIFQPLAGEAMRIISSGSVGIGTSSPISTLAVKGVAGTNPFVISSSTDAILLTLLQNGNFGIATSTPGFTFTVAGTSNFTNALNFNGAAGSSGNILQSNGSASAPSWVSTSTLGLQATITPGTGLTFTGNTLNSVWTTNGSNISNNNAGSVGIGTSSPSQKLDVWGNLNVATGTTPTLFVNTATAKVGIGTSTPNADLSVVGVSGSTDQLFDVASSSGASFLHVMANGNVGIGSSTPVASLSVVGRGGVNPFVVASSTGVNLLTLLQNGNLGIGTSTPAERLQVAGNILIGAQPDSSQDWARKSSSTAGAFYTVAASPTTAIASTTAAAVYNGSLYVGTSKSNSAEVYRYNGDGTWTQLNITGTAGKFNTTTSIDAVTAMTVYNGYLYIGTTEANSAEIYRYDGGTTWTRVTPAAGALMTTASIDGISAMSVHNGYLYVGTNEADLAQVYRYEGGATSTSWSVLNSTAGTFSGTASVNTVSSMVSFNGNLYIGTTEGAVAQILRYDGSQTWVQVNLAAGSMSGIVNGVASTTASILGFPAMAVYNGSLYAGTFKTDAAEVWRYNMGFATTSTDWTRVSSSTAAGRIANSGTASIDKISSMTIYNGNLYVGTGETNKAEVYKLDVAGSFLLVTNSTAGGIPVTSPPTTSIDEVANLQVYNGKLYAMTGEVGIAGSTEVYEYQSIEGQSYALKFNAASDNANAEQNGLLNTGSITFYAEEQGRNNRGTESTGRFYFSHGINTAFGAYDLAEDYPTRDDTLEAGDLVSIDTSERLFVKRSTGLYDNNIVGVFSSNPALRLSQVDSTIDGADAVPVALAGRVPVKVSAENGPIEIGDYLTVSSEPGKAAKAISAGRVIGRALSPYHGNGGESAKVTVFLGFGSITAQDLIHPVPVDPNATSTPASGDATSTATSTGLTEIESGLAILSTFLNHPVSTSTSPISQMAVDRVVAGLDVISPRVLTKGLVVDHINALDREILFSDDVIFFGRPYFNSDTAGFAVIKSGARNVDITFDNPYLDQPIVNASISFDQSTSSSASSSENVELASEEDFFASGIQYIINKKNEDGFTITLNKPAPFDIKFSWIALAVKSAKTFASREVEATTENQPEPEPVVKIDPSTQTASLIDATTSPPISTGTTTEETKTDEPPVVEVPPEPPIPSDPPEIMPDSVDLNSNENASAPDAATTTPMPTADNNNAAASGDDSSNNP